MILVSPLLYKKMAKVLNKENEPKVEKLYIKGEIKKKVSRRFPVKGIRPSLYGTGA